MKTDFTPALRPFGVSELRCGHTDCCYYTADTDSCDYMLIEYRRRGCPPEPACPCYAPAGRLREDGSGSEAARVQAYADMGWSMRRIARRLHISRVALRRLHARGARK